MKKTILALSFALLIPITGCVSQSAEGVQSSSIGCDQPPTLDEDTQTVAVLGQQGPTAAERYQSEITTVIQGAKDMEARVFINGVGSEVGAPSRLANVVLEGEGANPTERKDNLACKEKLVQEGFAQLAALPDTQPLDVIGALARLQGMLSGSAAENTDVVLLSSVLNSAKPVDLSQADNLGDPEQSLETLESMGLIVNCKGWQVYVVGGSHDGIAGLTNAQDAQLHTFWTEYFNRCGGTIVAWTPNLDTFPITG